MPTVSVNINYCGGSNFNFISIQSNQMLFLNIIFLQFFTLIHSYILLNSNTSDVSKGPRKQRRQNIHKTNKVWFKKKVDNILVQNKLFYTKAFRKHFVAIQKFIIRNFIIPKVFTVLMGVNTARREILRKKNSKNHLPQFLFHICHAGHCLYPNKQTPRKEKCSKGFPPLSTFLYDIFMLLFSTKITKIQSQELQYCISF